MKNAAPREKSSFALYVHIPYCQHKCPYCDFNTYAISRIPEGPYRDGVLRELELRVDQPQWNGRAIGSLYFGGGTPSTFSVSALQSIIERAKNIAGIQEGAEVALEANPVGLDERYLADLKEAGVNRLSIGAQSFQAHSLKILGRNHGPDDIRMAFRTARDVGFSDISLDLLYGSPDQSVENFRDDLQEVLALGPEHVSSYCLSLEPGTPYFQAYEKGSIHIPHEDVVLQMMDLLENTLSAAGYEQYELSNFAKPGRRSRHNWEYWEGKDYLGLGAGAHSFVADNAFLATGRRWSNIAGPEAYWTSLQEGKFPEAWSEALVEKDRQYEFFFLGLRKNEGVYEKEFMRRFQVSFDDVYHAEIQILLQAELLERGPHSLKLTRKGRRLSDSVFGEFAH